MLNKEFFVFVLMYIKFRKVMVMMKYEIYKVLSTLKNKKLKINNILIEKYKDLLKNPDFEQDYWSRTAQGVYKIAHDSIRLMKWICYYDRSYYENINYYDLMGSVCRYIIEIT